MCQIQNQKINQLLFISTLFFSGLIINGFGVLSPAYFSLAIIVLLLPVYIIKIKSKFLSSNLVFIFLGLWFFLEFFINPTGDKKTGLFLIISVLSYPIFDLLCKHITKKQILLFSQKYIDFIIIVYLFELLIRLKRVNFNFSMFFLPQFFLNKFYILKEDIIIGGGDTNFIATHLLVIFFFTLYLKKRFYMKLNVHLFILFILLFFTFSRAGWIALILGVLTFKIIYKKNKLSFIKLFLILVFIIIFLFVSLHVLADDGSFQTKIGIINITIDFIKNANFFNFIFGLGFLNSIEIIKYNVAHNLISTLLMDTGFISFILYFWCWGIILKQSKGHTLFILLPIFIFSLSFIQQMIPYLYCCLAIITNLEEKNDFSDYSCIQC